MRRISINIGDVLAPGSFFYLGSHLGEYITGESALAPIFGYLACSIWMLGWLYSRE